MNKKEKNKKNTDTYQADVLYEKAFEDGGKKAFKAIEKEIEGRIKDLYDNPETEPHSSEVSFEVDGLRTALTIIKKHR